MMTSRLHKAPQQSPGRVRKMLDMVIASRFFFGILGAAETAWKIKHMSRILTVLTLPNNRDRVA
jgi:hypothetical protein